MHGGTDLFSAILGLCAVYDVCFMNGSWMAMFLIWARANVVLFDLAFSLGPNLLYNSEYWSSNLRAAVFLADCALIVGNAALQAKLAMQAKAILEDNVPDWRNQIVYGTGAQPPAAVQQPLLGQSPA